LNRPDPPTAAGEINMKKGFATPRLGDARPL
jgi:hypothetical protein